jgi:lysophospholipase L1-like esterase
MIRALAPLLVVLIPLPGDLEECRPRSGLSSFFAKCAGPGAALRVAYLGGSITAQAGWRPKSLALLQKTWPEARFSEINAAIGGTGSDLGVFRLSRDVLQHEPDLLFVEFAVNDGMAPREQILRCMEGIVRQTRRERPDCDICFVYTITEALVGPLLDGRLPAAAAAMEEVADRYGLPTIHLGLEVARLAKRGKLIWSGALPKTDEEKARLDGAVVFANDSVHPYPETGHELYLKAIERSLPRIRAASEAPAPRGLPEPLVAANYERARLVPIPKAALSPGFTLLDPAKDDFGKRWAARLPTLARGSKAGETLTFRFRGTRCAIYDIIGPDCGQVRVTLDGGPPKLIPRFDAYCTYHRLATLTLGAELPDEVHTVRIEIDPVSPDKAAILSTRKATMDKPERFAGTAFYPGAILVVGEVVE